MKKSEIRGEVEKKRWKLLKEYGIKKKELIRDSKDMVKRIIKMGEKRREVEMRMKKMKIDGKKLNEEIVEVINKMGDKEKKEIIKGKLKELEIENKVLKLRNDKIEMEGNKEKIKGGSYE